MTQKKSGNGKPSSGAKDVDLAEGLQTENNLDKVRDIIFGGQMRDYERRFESLEAEFQRRLASLDSAFEKKLKHLDGFLKREFEKIQKKNSQEKSDRAEAIKDLNNTITALGSRLEQRLADLDDLMSAETTEIRGDMERHRAEIVDDTKQLVETLTEIVRRENNELQNAKTDRLELANLFSEVAMRLNREFELPDE